MPDESQPKTMQTGSELSEPDHPVWRMANEFPPNEFGEEAWAAYGRELPHLLETSRGQWVAYHGGKRLGIALLPASLYDEVAGRGLSPEEWVICKIEPIVGREAIGMGTSWLEEET